MMTVKKLIQELQKYPENTQVLVYGYESGYCDANNIKLEKISLNCIDDPCSGPHGKAEEYCSKKFKKITAIIIS